MAVLEMKNCKECGKLFRPRSKNSVYCDGIHFRPCPVCGKPVEAKYLSDPARCCSNECKAQYRRSNTNTNQSIPSAVMNKIVNDLRSADDGRRFPQQSRNSAAAYKPSGGNTDKDQFVAELNKLGYTVVMDNRVPMILDISLDEAKKLVKDLNYNSSFGVRPSRESDNVKSDDKCDKEVNEYDEGDREKQYSQILCYRSH